MKILALIRNEIERLKEETHNIRCQHNEKYCIGYDDAFNDLLSSLDTLPDEPISEDLEEAAGLYLDNHKPLTRYNWGDLMDAFKAGAEWDAEHFRDTTKMVDKSLEEAAKEYDEAESWRYEALKYPRREAFEAGAEWQRNQLKTNSISAGYNQTDEEYDREMDFATSIIEKEHRQPTFSDAINYGIKLQKEKMMKDAVEGEIVKDISNKLAVTAKNINLDGFKFGDKVKIIIVKEEEQ